MTTVDAKLVTIVQAIKQSIETSNNPGLSVNAHPNAFFLNVNGAVDLLSAARLVEQRLIAYEVGLKARFEADVAAIGEKILAEYHAGAVSIEDALARIKAKAGGELLAAEGVLMTAISKVGSVFGAKQEASTDPDGHG
jgi:hypothetical protein